MLKWTSLTAKLFVAALAVSFCGSIAMAADANNPAHKIQQKRVVKDRTDMQVQEMTKKLDLTQKQQEEYKAILQDDMKQRQAVVKDQALTEEQKRTKIQEIHKETMQKTEQMLTPEQKEKLKKLQQEQRESRRPHAKVPADSNSAKTK